MTSLSFIETEAHQLVRRLPESRRLTQQAALVELCETHWRSIRLGIKGLDSMISYCCKLGDCCRPGTVGQDI